MYHNLFRITLLVTTIAIILAACGTPVPTTEAPVATDAVAPATELAPTNTPEPTAAQVVLGVVIGRIAFRSTRSGSDDIWVMNGDGSGLTNLTNGGHNESPVWSPDGTRITFCTNRDGNYEIYVINADGSGQTNLSNNPADD